ncbi:MAG: RNA-binding domain-containing protein [Aequorivita antarctica]
MITDEEFQIILNKNESSVLDFKEEIYDFNNDRNGIVTSKYVKDVISFCNTIRTETSYIIFGVKEKEDKTVNLVGISNTIDDSILQDKIKDKVIPRPIFSFYTKEYYNKKFGILEFPIYRYEMPIIPTVKNLKGLESGKVYYRNGSSNTEANAIDIIRINDWLKTLPEAATKENLNDKISKYINELTKGEVKLSSIFSNLFLLSKDYNLDYLSEFCQSELSGTNKESVNEDDYRIVNCFISWNKLNINPYSMHKPTAQLVKNEMDEHKEFFKYKIAISQPIIAIESMIEKMGNDSDSFYGTLESDTQTLLGMEKKHKIYIYLFPDDLSNLYRNIRQKAIDIIMQL